MAFSCNFDAPNGKKSLLYIQLEAALGTDEATRWWNYVQSEEFGKKYMGEWTIPALIQAAKDQAGEAWLERFKDWMDINHGIPTDSNGEPTADWLAAREGLDIKTPETKVVKKAAADILTHNEKSLFGAAKKEKRMNDEEALRKVREIYEAAANNPDKEYDLTDFNARPINKPGASGYSPAELADLFVSLPIPGNVHFSSEFEALMRNTSSYQLQNMDVREIAFMNYEEAALRNAKEGLFVAKRSDRNQLDAPGEQTGEYFTSDQQVAAVDSMTALVWEQFQKNPEMDVKSILGVKGEVYKIFNNRRRLFASKEALALVQHNMTEEEADEKAAAIQEVLNSWEDLANRALIKLAGLGLRPKGKIVKGDKEVEAEHEQAKNLEDYYDSSFELDPRDTASARIKLFLAAIPETEVSLEREPRHVKLSFNNEDVRKRFFDPTSPKSATVRTSAQLKDLKMAPGGDYVFTVDGVKFRATVERQLGHEDFEAPDTHGDQYLKDRSLEGNTYEEGIDAHPGDWVIRLKKWAPEADKVQTSYNHLGLNKLVDFEDLFQELLEITSGVQPIYSSIKAALEQEAEVYRPNLFAVVKRLDKVSEDIRNEFVKVMSKQYQEFSLVLFSRQKDGTMKLSAFNANQGSAVNSIMNQWKENQKHTAMVSTDSAGNMVVNAELATQFNNELQAFRKRIESKKNLPNVQTELRPFVERLLEANGIIMPVAAIDHLMNSKFITDLTKGTGLAGGVMDQFSFTKEGAPRGIFSAIVSKLIGATEEEADENYLKNNNPLYTENTAMRILARLAYRYSPRTASGSHLNSEGKSIYSFGHRTHLSNIVDQIRNDADFRDQLLGTHAGKHNWLLKRINDRQVDSEFGLRYVDGLKDGNKTGARGITRPKMSSREQLLFTMAQYMSGSQKTANFLSLTHSDKSTTPVFMNIPKFMLRDGGQLTQDIKKAIYQTFLGEYERIVDWHTQKGPDGKVSTKNDSFNKGGGFYYLFPHLNYDNMLKLQKTGKVSKDEFQLLWLAKGKPNVNLDPVAGMKFITKLFENEYLKPEVDSLYKQMVSEGFVEQKLIDGNYINNNLGNAGMYKKIAWDDFTRRKVTEYYLKDGTKIDEATMYDNMAQFAAKDMTTNYFLVHTALTGMIFGDPALTFKPGKYSTKDYQMVEDSMKEYQKRLAKDIAPGADPAWEQGPEEQYKTITIADDERVHKDLEDIYGDKAINASDAQELTTVREHLYIMKCNGTLDSKTYAEMVQVIDDGVRNHPDKYYEFKDPKHKAVVMQIMKPVSVSHNFNEVPGMSTLQYVKSSAMPLYPPMTKAYQIDELRKTMEGDGNPTTHIPRANYISAKKMGAPAGKGVKIYDAEGNISIDPNSKEWATAQQLLRRGGLRMQQEVPYDETKDAILTGSQDNKLFSAGVDAIKEFVVRGFNEPIAGTDFKHVKEQIRMDLVKQQLQDFYEDLKAHPESGVVDTPSLIGKLIQEATSRNYPPNDVIMLQRQVEGLTGPELAIPLFFNPSSSRFESLLMSLIKDIGKVYFPGKSYIQASSAGFKFKKKMNFEDMKDSDKEGIVWLPGYEGGDLRTMQRDADGSYSKPAQVLMPFNFLVNGKPADVKDFITTDPKTGKKFLDHNKVPKELTQLIGFRIPTQGHNSMLPIEVVGFVPANLGDIIVVPAAITMQMGSDFDVDKLYTYRRPYKYIASKVKALPGESLAAASGRFVPINTETKTREDAYRRWLASANPEAMNMTDEQADEALRNEMASVPDAQRDEYLAKFQEFADEYTSSAKDQLLTKYFDMHWSVLTHPEMYDKVMSPLDKPDLKNEARRADAGGSDAINPYFSMKRQLDDFASQKDAKVMVGISSLSVVFAAITQDMNLEVSRKVKERDEDGELTGETKVQPNGISFIPEGEMEAEHAYRISDKGESEYYEDDVEERGTADGLKKFFVDPVTGEQNGEFDRSKALKRTKLDDLTSLQSEFLDHAKNRTIDKLNINLQTIYASLALMSMSAANGKKANSKHLSLFLRQPAIVNLVKSLSLAQDSLSTVFNPNEAEEQIKEAVRQLVEVAQEIDDSAIDYSSPDLMGELSKKNYTTLHIPDMKSAIAEAEGKNKDASWYLHQAGMLLTFQHLTSIGEELGDIQKVLNQDPRGPGKNMITVLDTIAKRANVSMNPLIANAGDLFDTEVGYIHKTELDTAATAFSSVLPYNGIAFMIDDIKKMTGRVRMSIENQQEIVEAFKSFVFSNSELGISQDAAYDRFRLLHGSKTEGTLADRVWEAQQTKWGRDNYFLQRLQPQQAETPNTPSYVFYRSSRSSTMDDQENTAAFLQLLLSDDAGQKKLAEDLVRYAYVTGGISGGFSFIRYIPADYLIALPFAAKLRETNNALTGAGKTVAAQFAEFRTQWMQHNPASGRKVSLELFQESGVNHIKSIAERFEMPNITADIARTKLGALLDTDSAGNSLWPEYISYFDKEEGFWKLFHKNGTREYRRIDTLGNSYINEYQLGAPGHVRSVLTENKALIAQEGASYKPTIQTYVNEEQITMGDESPFDRVAKAYKIEEGKPLNSADISILMKRMRDDKQLPDHERLIAGVLDGIIYGLKDVQPMTLNFVKAPSPDFGGGAAYEGGMSTVYTNDSDLKSKKDVANVVNHEMMHQVLYMYTHASAATRAKYPGAEAAFESVRQAHLEAKTAVEAAIMATDKDKKGTKFTVDEIANATVTTSQKMDDLVQLYYTVNNFDEFVNSVFTKRNLQQFLNSKQSKLDDSKTILGKFISFFTDFIKALATSLGITVQSGSMLETSLRRSMRFLEEVSQIREKPGTSQEINKLVQDYKQDYTLFGGQVTESEIDEIAEKLKRDYKHIDFEKTYDEKNGWDLKAKLNPNFKNPKLNLEPEEKEVTDPIARVYGKVQEQIQEIKASLAKNKLTPEILRQKKLLTDLGLLAKDLKATGDLDMIADVAEYQIKWAQTIADQYEMLKLPVSINEIMTAHRLAELWKDSLTLVYGGSNGALQTDARLAEASAQAQRLYDRFTGTIMKDVLKKIAKTDGRELTEDDFKGGLTDLPTAEAKFLDLSRAKSRLVQEVALVIENTNRHYLEESQRLVDKLADFEKRARALASKKGMSPQALYESVFQNGNHWGVVSRYSNAFYRWKAGIRRTLVNNINEIMENTPLEANRALAIKQRYAKYWRKLRDKAGYIDIRTVFDDAGEHKADAKATKYKNEMVEEYGQELADSLIAEAQTKYKKYLQDREDTFATYEADVDGGFMTQDEANEAKGNWDIENSPAYKLSTKDSDTKINAKYLNTLEDYLVLVPHRDAKDDRGNGFFDDRFAALQEDQEMKDFYDEVKQYMDEFTGNLPYYLNEKLGPDFLPAIHQKLVSEVSQLPQYVRQIPNKLMDMLTASTYEEAMQSRKKEIPIMYTENPLRSIPRPVAEKGKKPAAEELAKYEQAKADRLKNMSKDLPRILELFGIMSLHYKHFSEAKSAIDLGREVLTKAHEDMEGGLRQVERNGKTVTVKGGLENTLGSLEYAIDALMYKRTRDLEGKVGDLYRKRERGDVVEKVKKLKAKVEDLNKAYKNNEVTKEEWETQMKAINLELEKYEHRKFYGSKIGDTLITWSQMKALSYNPLSAVNNFAFGIISATIHAAGGQEFNTKEVLKAFSIMMNSTAKSLKLAKLAGNDSAMHKTSQKILALMERMGVMGELKDSDYGKSNVEHKKGGLKQALSPFEMMRQGDYFCKGLVMVATMMHQKVMVDGKEMSVWEAHDENGKFLGKDEKWFSDTNVAAQTEFDKLRNKVIGVNKIVMGNQDKSSPMWAKKSILWRLVGQFRLSWFAEGIASRFESERMDNQLGRVRKGRYRTYADLGLMQSVQMTLKQLLGSIGINAKPYDGVRFTNGKEMSDTDKANMRRNTAELMWFMLLFGAMHLVAAMSDPDDEDAKKRKYKFMANMITRSYQDVALYSNPGVFDTILGTPAPALGTIKDTQNFIKASAKLAMKDDYTAEQWFASLMRAGFIPQTTLYNKYQTMTKKDLSTLAR